MKQKLAFLVFALLLFASELAAQQTLSADRVLQKVADRLAAVKLLGYKYHFEFSYPSQGRLIEEKAQAFLDLRPKDGASQFRFQFDGVDRSGIYNGTERFTLDKRGKKLYLENKPSFKSFGDIFLQNSPLSLKYALPRIIADASIQKNVSLDHAQYLIEFSLPKGIINSEGEIVEIRPDQTNIYRLKIDKATLLPVEVIQSNDKNDEILKTTYTEINEKPALPTDLSWYFSTYQTEYALQRKDKLTLIKPGHSAPQFSLAGYESTPRLSLDQYKGKLVLIEFWIAQCGFCIAAVPKLNDINKKYQEKGLEMLSINMYDPTATIDFFRKKNKPEYAILTGGDSIAPAYGVDAFPAFVLVDRSGIAVYSSSGLRDTELDAAIGANLKK